ncbi:MAG: TrmO family methyltransferase [Candidatus Eremiobacterales bacterium]
MNEGAFEIRPVGVVRSTIKRRGDGPKQGREGAPDAKPLTGVFDTRSPDRPNPIGLHRVVVREIAGPRLRVGPLEAIDGTPIVDIKPALDGWDDF